MPGKLGKLGVRRQLLTAITSESVYAPRSEFLHYPVIVPNNHPNTHLQEIAWIRDPVLALGRGDGS
jgi:hypothetical protein